MCLNTTDTMCYIPIFQLTFDTDAIARTIFGLGHKNTILKPNIEKRTNSENTSVVFKKYSTFSRSFKYKTYNVDFLWNSYVTSPKCC